MWFEGCQNLIADRAVHRIVHVLGRAEQERQAENGGFLDQIVEGGGVDAVHVDDAETGLLNSVFLAAENGIVHDLDLDAAIASLGQQLAHVFHGFDGWITIRVDIGGAQGYFLRAGGHT
ncbi:hypothetical protein D3C71_1173000 [compost metagenome]